MADSILRDKSYQFAIRIVRLSQSLQTEKKKYVLSKQLLRSGTGIGALLREAEFGQSKADFVSKPSIALKEANETAYWLSLLKDTDYLAPTPYDAVAPDCRALIAMLVAPVKTAKPE
jgi:four helix bundle protein